jgi:hypothetical protein
MADGDHGAGYLLVRDLGAPFEAREAALETLLELLEATRSNGRPAYSLQLAAAKAIMADPAPFEPLESWIRRRLPGR